MKWFTRQKFALDQRWSRLKMLALLFSIGLAHAPLIAGVAIAQNKPLSSPFYTTWTISKPAALGQAKTYEPGPMFVWQGSVKTIYAVVFQDKGYPLPDAESPTALFKIGALAGETTIVLASRRVPSLGKGRKAEVKFAYTAEGTGDRKLRVCLTGIIGADGAVLPEQCGQERALYTLRRAKDTWIVGGVDVYPRSTESPPIILASSAQQLQFSVDYVESAYRYLKPDKVLIELRSGDGSVRPHTRAYTAQPIRFSVDGKEVYRPTYSIDVTGTYELRGCAQQVHPAVGAPQNLVCGPWSPVVVADVRSRKGTQPNCPPKRRMSNGRCCQAGQVARLNRCVTPAK